MQAILKWGLRYSRVGNKGGLDQKIRLCWDPWILIWYPLNTLLHIAQHIYATFYTFFITGKVPNNSTTNFIIDLLNDISQWLVWIAIIFASRSYIHFSWPVPRLYCGLIFHVAEILNLNLESQFQDNNYIGNILIWDVR